MTAHVLSKADGSSGPGLGSLRPVMGGGGRTLKMDVYDFNMGTDNYTSGGDDISDIWDDFSEVLIIVPVQKDTNTATDNRLLTVDYTNKTLLVYISDSTASITTESTAADQGVVTARLLVIGYA